MPAMPAFICTQCGTQFAESGMPPPRCPICEDERQYVRWLGQAWTTMGELATTHDLGWHQDEEVVGLAVEPSFAIGQRALLVREPEGCTLWDCVPLLTRNIVEFIRSQGGLKAIAISHPHFYSSMADWSEAFGDVPVYVHARDREWIMRPHPSIVTWDGERHRLSETLTLVRCGGHFPGSSILHWAGGAEGSGALLVGDTLSVTMDRAFVTFMYSFPNQIPLSAATIEGIAAALDGVRFNRIYGTSRGRNILNGAREAVDRSIARYLASIRD
jgi:hypothetical protein